MDTNEQEASAQQPAPEKPSWHIPHGPGRFLLGVGLVLFAMSADGLPAPIRTFSLVAGGWLLFGMIWARARDDAADRDEQFSQRIWGVMEVHGETLRRKRLQLEHVDDYGNVFMDAWEAEKGYFIANVVLPALGKAELLPREAGRLDELIELVAQPPRGAAGIKDASAMSPLEYEHYCAALLSEGGWSTRVTPEGGDQGVDIVAKKNDKTLVVQVKRYEGSVGNAAVQQVVAGRMHLKADYAVVVSPAPFTKSARELAATTGVLLVHHDQLAALDLLP